jgi:signal transduction histidine kinase/CheY-like chemotaxis protein/Tfp pilus assembly protein PilF
LGDYDRAARTYNNIGSLYIDLNNLDQAEKYYLRSLSLFQIGADELLIAEIENNLANIYQKKGYELKALYHYSNTLEVFRRLSSAVDVSTALNNIGLIYYSRKQYKKALPFFRESYEIDLKYPDANALILIMSNLSLSYLYQNKKDSAQYFANAGLAFVAKNPGLSYLVNIYAANAELYAKMHNKGKAEYYTKLKLAAENNILNKEQRSDISAIAAEYESERKDHKLKLMDKENEINHLKIEEQQSAIDRRNILLVATFMVIFFLLLITGLVFYTLSLNKKNKLFELSNKAKSNVLQQINHEIRTPLNGIVGMSHLAIESKTFTELKEYLTYIKLSSDELMFVLNNLITYLQIDRKEAAPIANPFDLLESIEELFKIYGFQCKQKGLLFNQMVFPGLPRMVNGDKQKLMNILQNLLSNAVRFSNKGVVKIEVKEIATRVKDQANLSTIQFSIIDEGPGLNEKEIKQIFKGIPKISASQNGFGIGLKNAKELCDLMKGRIEVVSEKGIGSSFVLELELENIDLETDNFYISADTQKPIDPSSTMILVVEDNILNQKVIEKVLERQGYQYMLAINGKKALSLLKEKTFDLILMNIRLPEMDGIETAYQIRNSEEFVLDKHIPILAITANDDSEEKRKCFEVGINDYMTKPFNTLLLIKKIEELLRAGSLK